MLSRDTSNAVVLMPSTTVQNYQDAMENVLGCLSILWPGTRILLCHRINDDGDVRIDSANLEQPGDKLPIIISKLTLLHLLLWPIRMLMFRVFTVMVNILVNC